MEEFNLSNILDTEEIDTLFTTAEPVNENTEQSEESNKEENNKKTTEVNTDTLFSKTPERVSSEQNNQESGDEDTSNIEDSSPKSSNFYSSIAAALKEEGVLPDLEDSKIENIKTPEEFTKAIDEHISSRLEEKQKRIDEALNVGLEPNEIRQFENTLQYLNELKEESIVAENDEGENLRKQLIFQDFINRGFTKERASKEIEKSFNAGTDVEDAKEALNSNKEFFSEMYKSKIEEKRKEETKLAEEKTKELSNLKKAILENDEPMIGVKLDKTTREKVYNVISKPIHKGEDGKYYTELQKYEKDHKQDFLKNIGILYTLTNGFKNLDTVIKTEVNKKTNSKVKELSHVLNNTSRNVDGSIKFITSESDDSESKMKFQLDI